MVVHYKHSLSAVVNHWLITALSIEQLQSPTTVTVAAISHIECHLIFMTINTELKEANTQGMWELEFEKSFWYFFYLIFNIFFQNFFCRKTNVFLANTCSCFFFQNSGSNIFPAYWSLLNLCWLPQKYFEVVSFPKLVVLSVFMD